MYCCNSLTTKTISEIPDINRYNLPESERIQYLDNLRINIRKYYSSSVLDQAIIKNKLAYDQGGELLEQWLQTLENRYGKNPSQFIIDNIEQI